MAFLQHQQQTKNTAGENAAQVIIGGSSNNVAAAAADMPDAMDLIKAQDFGPTAVDDGGRRTQSTPQAAVPSHLSMAIRRQQQQYGLGSQRPRLGSSSSSGGDRIVLEKRDSTESCPLTPPSPRVTNLQPGAISKQQPHSPLTPNSGPTTPSAQVPQISPTSPTMTGTPTQVESHKKVSPAELNRIKINQAGEYYRKQREEFERRKKEEELKQQNKQKLLEEQRQQQLRQQQLILQQQREREHREQQQRAFEAEQILRQQEQARLPEPPPLIPNDPNSPVVEVPRHRPITINHRVMNNSNIDLGAIVNSTIVDGVTKEFTQHRIVVGKDLKVLLLDFDGTFALLIPNIKEGVAFEGNTTNVEVQRKHLGNGQTLTFMKFQFQSPPTEITAPVLDNRNTGVDVLRSNSACVLLGNILGSIKPTPHVPQAVPVPQPIVVQQQQPFAVNAQVPRAPFNVVAQPSQQQKVLNPTVKTPSSLSITPVVTKQVPPNPHHLVQTPPAPPPAPSMPRVISDTSSSLSDVPANMAAAKISNSSTHLSTNNQAASGQDQKDDPPAPTTPSQLQNPYPALKPGEKDTLTQCRYCSKRFVFVSELLVHLQKHVPDVNSVAEMSLKIWVQDRRLKCDKCKKKTSYTLDYAKHKDSHIVPGLCCEICKCETETPDEYAKHLEIHHQSVIFSVPASQPPPTKSSPPREDKTSKRCDESSITKEAEDDAKERSKSNGLEEHDDAPGTNDNGGGALDNKEKGEKHLDALGLIGSSIPRDKDGENGASINEETISGEEGNVPQSSKPCRESLDSKPDSVLNEMLDEITEAVENIRDEEGKADNMPIMDVEIFASLGEGNEGNDPGKDTNCTMKDDEVDEYDDFTLALSPDDDVGDQTHSCGNCGDEFRTPTALKIHSMKCSNRCEFCREQFMSWTSFNMHRKICDKKSTALSPSPSMATTAPSVPTIPNTSEESMHISKAQGSCEEESRDRLPVGKSLLQQHMDSLSSPKSRTPETSKASSVLSDDSDDNDGDKTPSLAPFYPQSQGSGEKSKSSVAYFSSSEDEEGYKKPPRKVPSRRTSAQNYEAPDIQDEDFGGDLNYDTILEEQDKGGIKLKIKKQPKNGEPDTRHGFQKTSDENEHRQPLVKPLVLNVSNIRESCQRGRGRGRGRGAHGGGRGVVKSTKSKPLKLKINLRELPSAPNEQSGDSENGVNIDQGDSRTLGKAASTSALSSDKNDEKSTRKVSPLKISDLKNNSPMKARLSVPTKTNDEESTTQKVPKLVIKAPAPPSEIPDEPLSDRSLAIVFGAKMMPRGRRPRTRHQSGLQAHLSCLSCSVNLEPLRVQTLGKEGRHSDVPKKKSIGEPLKLSQEDILKITTSSIPKNVSEKRLSRKVLRPLTLQVPLDSSVPLIRDRRGEKLSKILQALSPVRKNAQSTKPEQPSLEGSSTMAFTARETAPIRELPEDKSVNGQGVVTDFNTALTLIASIDDSECIANAVLDGVISSVVHKEEENNNEHSQDARVEGDSKFTVIRIPNSRPKVSKRNGIGLNGSDYTKRAKRKRKVEKLIIRRNQVVNNKPEVKGAASWSLCENIVNEVVASLQCYAPKVPPITIRPSKKHKKSKKSKKTRESIQGNEPTAKIPPLKIKLSVSRGASGIPVVQKTSKDPEEKQSSKKNTTAMVGHQQPVEQVKAKKPKTKSVAKTLSELVNLDVKETIAEVTRARKSSGCSGLASLFHHARTPSPDGMVPRNRRNSKRELWVLGRRSPTPPSRQQVMIKNPPFFAKKSSASISSLGPEKELSKPDKEEVEQESETNIVNSTIQAIELERQGGGDEAASSVFSLVDDLFENNVVSYNDVLEENDEQPTNEGAGRSSSTEEVGPTGAAESGTIKVESSKEIIAGILDDLITGVVNAAAAPMINKQVKRKRNRSSGSFSRDSYTKRRKSVRNLSICPSLEDQSPDNNAQTTTDHAGKALKVNTITENILSQTSKVPNKKRSKSHSPFSRGSYVKKRRRSSKGLYNQTSTESEGCCEDKEEKFTQEIPVKEGQLKVGTSERGVNERVTDKKEGLEAEATSINSSLKKKSGILKAFSGRSYVKRRKKLNRLPRPKEDCEIVSEILDHIIERTIVSSSTKPKNSRVNPKVVRARKKTLASKNPFARNCYAKRRKGKKRKRPEQTSNLSLSLARDILDETIERAMKESAKNENWAALVNGVRVSPPPTTTGGGDEEDPPRDRPSVSSSKYSDIQCLPYKFDYEFIGPDGLAVDSSPCNNETSQDEFSSDEAVVRKMKQIKTNNKSSKRDAFDRSSYVKKKRKKKRLCLTSIESAPAPEVKRRRTSLDNHIEDEISKEELVSLKPRPVPGEPKTIFLEDEFVAIPEGKEPEELGRGRRKRNVPAKLCPCNCGGDRDSCTVPDKKCKI